MVNDAEMRIWLTIDGAVIALFGLVLLDYVGRAPHAASGSAGIAAILFSRTPAFAVIVGVLNLGLLLIGRLAQRTSTGDAILSLLAAGIVLLLGCAGLWLVLVFSFPQY